MRREVVGYVIREGKVRGQGRYVQREPGPGWVADRFDAMVWWGPMQRPAAACWLKEQPGRVVAIVRKAKTEGHLELDQVCFERDIARADQKRAEESKAAAWEQVRGLQMRVKEIEGTCVALGNKIHAARKALG